MTFSMPGTMARLAVVSCLSLWCSVLASAAPGQADRPVGDEKIDFVRDIYPLLKKRCFRCHQGSDPSSGKRLDLRAAWLGQADGLPLAQVGASGKSRVIHLISGQDEELVMPPKGRRPLSAEQIELFRDWIDQGLAWDDRLLPPLPPSRHWAFQPLTHPAIPQVQQSSWVRNPIDAFILARLQSNGLSPAPEADRPTLIRRLTLDLLGLPPTPEEIKEFVDDPRPDAYERLVDRLLASPAYGTRWGRHWLDLARWADSEGYESNHLRPYAWRYRDYVVDSFNSDKPYPLFVRQQLAGDELEPFCDENLIATGFLAAARLSSNEEDKARQRNDVLVDIVNATGQTFLGLSIHCAQCHSHKFDPLTARDYYRLEAFFLQGQPVNVELRDPDLWARYRRLCPPEVDDLREEKERLFEASRQGLIAEAKKTLTPAMLEALAVPANRRTEEQEELARQANLKFQFTPNHIEKAIPAENRKRYQEVKKKLEKLEKKLPDRPQTWAFYSPVTSSHKLEVLPMKGFYPLPFEPDQLAQLRPHLLIRGDVHRRGPRLQAGWPAVFGPTPAGVGADKPRLALANWLTDPEHPLVGRVWVNRLWHYHFGHGIVATPSDFGTQGARPSHPQLLDWLTREFWRQGGRTKPLHRLIVSSSTYRQSSRVYEDRARRDPDNAFCWHWSPRRLEAEVIRDMTLAVSGELDRQAGGPGDTDENQSQRRTLYLLQKRDRPPEVQALFDGPAAVTASCPERTVSTVPLQSLFLLNSEFAQKRAEAFARRVHQQAGNDLGQQVEQAMLLALGRRPAAREREALEHFLRIYPGEAPAGSLPRGLVSLCQTLLNVNEFLYLE